MEPKSIFPSLSSRTSYFAPTPATGLHSNSLQVGNAFSVETEYDNMMSPTLQTSLMVDRNLHALSPHHSDVPNYSLAETPQGGFLPITPPFNPQENYFRITSEGTAVALELDPKIDKGFFFSGDKVWTCYRRNYFSVNVSYRLSPCMSNAQLCLDQGGSEPLKCIQSIAVSLAATVDGVEGKRIELIQATPRRNKRPQLMVKKDLLAPNPPGIIHNYISYRTNNFNSSEQIAGPQLPLRRDSERSQQYPPTGHSNNDYRHTFERIQFKSATSINRKRRAQQQYYHLIVELWANIQNPGDTDPRWVKVAARLSHPVVVRGRSPSHYQGGAHDKTSLQGTRIVSLGGSVDHGLGSGGGATYGGDYCNGFAGSKTFINMIEPHNG